MNISDISSDDPYSQFTETSPASVLHNGRTITAEKAHLRKSPALHQINKRLHFQWVSNLDSIQHLHTRKKTFSHKDVLPHQHPIIASHVWRNITKFCKKHKVAICATLAVIAVAATAATVIICGAKAGLGLAAAGEAIKAAGDQNSKKPEEKKKSEPAQSNQKLQEVSLRLLPHQLPSR